MPLSEPGAGCLLIAPRDLPLPTVDLTVVDDGRPRKAVLAGGCFWCTEAVYLQLDGVLAVTSGYAGGTRETADYRTVCTGATGHAEAIEIVYDPRRISYGRLLQIFFAVAHDPTQLDRQGNDRGPQYRSAIFCANDDERRVAADYIRQLAAAGVFRSPIVTTLEPLTTFFPAEAYHQNYAAQHPDQPYVAAAALPKASKVRQQFPD